MTKKNLKLFFYFILTIALTMGLSLSLQSVIAAWVAPTLAPPDGNTPEPINKGSLLQVKDGPLYVNAGVAPAATGFVVWSGNVGVGTAGPVAKLDITLGASGHVPMLYSSNLWPQFPRTLQNISASITTNDTTVATGPVVGINLENSSPTNNTYSPLITFSRHSANGAYNTTYASIGGIATGNGADASWTAGDLVFGTTDYAGPLERMRIKATGNVGVGTAGPVAKLDITLGASGHVPMLYSSNLWPQFPRTLQNISASITTNDTTVATGPVVGINLENSSPTNNTYSPLITFSRHSANGAYNTTYASIGGIATGNGADASWTAGDLVFGTTDYAGPLERMRIKATGNVGIGTINPGSYKLNVQGGQINSSGGLCIANDCKTAWDQVAGTNYWTLTGNNLYPATIANNVGIGTISPGAKLSVSGAGGSALTGGLEWFSTGNASGYSGWAGRAFIDIPSGGWGTAPFVFSVPNTSGVEVKTLTLLNGNVGIGTTNPTQALTLGGTRGIGFNDWTSDKKLYAPADGLLRWTTNNAAGSHAFEISHADSTTYWHLDTTGNSYYNSGGGNFGIGTPNPGAKLHVASLYSGVFGSDGMLKIKSVDNGGCCGTEAITLQTSIDGRTDDYVISGYGGDSRHVLSLQPSGGYVGIGTIGPNAKLTVGAALGGTVLGTTFITNSGALGGVAGNTLTLGNFGFAAGNGTSLGIRAYRIANGADWTTAAITLGMDVDNTVNAGGFLSFKSGNVGIGIAAPGYKLDVQGGQINASGGLCIAGDCKTAWNQVTGANYWTLTGNNLYPAAIANNVGIGTANPGTKLQLQDAQTELSMGTNNDPTAYNRFGFNTIWQGYWAQNAAWNGTQWNYVNTGGYGGQAVKLQEYNGTFQIDTANNGVNPVLWNTRMFIANNGNVGIGTADPNYKLDVRGGGIYANGGGGIGINGYSGGGAAVKGTTDGTTLNNIGVYGVNIGATGNGIAVRADGGAGFAFFSNNGKSYFGGNVGIGTTDPQSQLHLYSVNGAAALTVDSSGLANQYALIRAKNSGRSWVLQNDANTFDFYIRDETANTFPFTIKPNAPNFSIFVGSTGNVGIGVPNPTYRLQLSTDSAAKPTSNTWTVASDARLKNVVGVYGRGLNEILQINPILYTYKEDNALKIVDPGEHIGIIAQDVRKVIPEAIELDAKGYLHFNADPLIWANINAIKELNAKIENQQREINDLKQKLQK